jgi:hypothetical protein
MNVMSVIMQIVMLIIGLNVFGAVSGSFNMPSFSPGISSMFSMVPMVVMGAMIIGILVSVVRVRA